MIDWREHAACRGMDPDVFFPTCGARAYREARAVCAVCPVRRACLEAELEAEHGLGRGSNLRYGMRGGTTPDDRGAMAWLYKLKASA